MRLAALDFRIIEPNNGGWVDLVPGSTSQEGAYFQLFVEQLYGPVLGGLSPRLSCRTPVYSSSFPRQAKPAPKVLDTLFLWGGFRINSLPRFSGQGPPPAHWILIRESIEVWLLILQASLIKVFISVLYFRK